MCATDKTLPILINQCIWLVHAQISSSNEIRLHEGLHNIGHTSHWHTPLQKNQVQLLTMQMMSVKMSNHRFLQMLEIMSSYQNSKTLITYVDRHNKPTKPSIIFKKKKKKQPYSWLNTTYPTFCTILLYLANLGIKHAQKALSTF